LDAAARLAKAAMPAFRPCVPRPPAGPCPPHQPIRVGADPHAVRHLLQWRSPASDGTFRELCCAEDGEESPAGLAPAAADAHAEEEGLGVVGSPSSHRRQLDGPPSPPPPSPPPPSPPPLPSASPPPASTQLESAPARKGRALSAPPTSPPPSPPPAAPTPPSLPLPAALAPALSVRVDTGLATLALALSIACAGLLHFFGRAIRRRHGGPRSSEARRQRKATRLVAKAHRVLAAGDAAAAPPAVPEWQSGVVAIGALAAGGGAPPTLVGTGCVVYLPPAEEEVGARDCTRLHQSAVRSHKIGARLHEI